MTALMVLALTVPPSIAFIVERWMRGREAQARKLSMGESNLLDTHQQRLDAGEARFAEQGAELKRLNEQVSLLSDRYRA